MTPPEPDPSPDHRARLPTIVWVLLIFGLACVIGGYLVARLGPRLFPASHAAVQGDRLASRPAPSK